MLWYKCDITLLIHNYKKIIFLRLTGDKLYNDSDKYLTYVFAI